MNENSENSTKSSTCDNDYVNGDVKVRDHCHVTGKYRDSVISRLISAKAKLNQEFLWYSTISRIMIYISLCKN